jgi:hypothetical protein
MKMDAPAKAHLYLNGGLSEILKDLQKQFSLRIGSSSSQGYLRWTILTPKVAI